MTREQKLKRMREIMRYKETKEEEDTLSAAEKEQLNHLEPFNTAQETERTTQQRTEAIR